MHVHDRASELIFYGNLTTGAHDDLETATESAYAQVTKYGMTDRVGHDTCHSKVVRGVTSMTLLATADIVYCGSK